MNNILIIGNKYRIYLNNGFCYIGDLLDEDKDYYKILDDRKQVEQILPKAIVTNIEVIEEVN